MTSGTFSARHQQRRGKKIDTQLLRAIIDQLPSGTTVMDYGAGNGQYVAALRDHGYQAYGLDGTRGIETLTGGLVTEADLTTPIRLAHTHTAISIETGEHIPQEHEDQYARNISENTTTTIIISWATTGQRGRGHINCKDPEQVEQLFQRNGGWKRAKRATRKARRTAGKGWDRKLLVLTRQ